MRINEQTVSTPKNPQITRSSNEFRLSFCSSTTESLLQGQTALPSISMNVSFSNPGLLWGVLALAMPLIVHLLLRRRPTVENWGASRFLRKVVHRQKAERNVHALTQLFIRMAILSLVILALADPRPDSISASQNLTANTNRLLVIDDTLSMGTTDDNGISRLEHVRRQVGSLVSRSRAGDSWQLLLHGQNDQPARIRIPTYDPEQLLDEIAQLTTSFQSASMADTFQQALSLAEEIPQTRNEVLIFSDLATSDWELSESQSFSANSRLEQLSQIATLSIIDVGTPASTPANISIRNVEVSLPQETESQSRGIDVEIENHSNSSGKTRVVLSIDAEIVSERICHLPANDSSSMHFDITITEPGLHYGELKIDEDALAADNSYKFVIPVHNAIKVLIVEEPANQRQELTQADFIELALTPPAKENTVPGVEGPHHRYQVTRVSPLQFRSEDLSRFDVVILCSLANPQLTDAQRVYQFAELGGGVLLTMGDSISIPLYNRFLGSEDQVLMPVTLNQRFDLPADAPTPLRIGRVDENHPLIEPFLIHPDSGLLTTRIYSYVQATILPNSGATRMIDLESSDPLLIESQVGLGKCTLITTALNAKWGSWVLWPSFLPLMQRCIDHLAQRESFLITSVIGREIPDKCLPVEMFRTIENQSQQIVWSQTSESELLPDIFDSHLSTPGIYSLKTTAPIQTVQVVQRLADPVESKAVRVDLTSLRENSYLRGINLDVVDDVKVLAEARQISARSQESTLSRWLLFTAILLLLVDQLFALQSHVAMGALAGGLIGGIVVLNTQLSPTLTALIPILGALIGGGVVMRTLQRRKRFLGSGHRN